jgi:hypothetical protein
MFDNSQYIDSMNLVLSKIDSKDRYLLLVAENSDFDIKKLPSSHQIVGGIFPQIVFDCKTYDKGYILAKMTKSTNTFLVKDMGKEFDSKDLELLKSYFILVDGYSFKCSSFLNRFLEKVSESCKIFGGGAGKLGVKNEAVIFSGNTLYKDAAIVMGSFEHIGVGVRHGWEEVRGPFIVTDASNRDLKKINYVEAFSFYKNIVEEDLGAQMDEENFFEIAKNYPFGITRYSREFIVRDPMFTDGKSLELIGDIEPNSIVSILKGDKEELVKAAKEACIDSIHNKKDAKKSQQLLIVDCVTRFLFLEDTFKKELEEIQKQVGRGIPIWGVLSLGEIANANQENIEYLNKTCVVGNL